MAIFLTIIKFISLFVFVVCFFSYINCIINEISSIVTYSRTFGNSEDEHDPKKYAAYKINLSIIMGLTLAILVCL
jgi:hypothetical protein